jgi:uncharacterized protein (DUF1330 family)
MSVAHTGKFLASQNPNWKGGRRIKDNGYIIVYAPQHPHNVRKYVYEHRLVIEKHIGRYLRKGEIVHHINGIRTDNRLKNLKLFSSDSKHRSLHPLVKVHKKLITLTVQS